jgi:hypothetical protein
MHLNAKKEHLNLKTERPTPALANSGSRNGKRASTFAGPAEAQCLACADKTPEGGDFFFGFFFCILIAAGARLWVCACCCPLAKSRSVHFWALPHAHSPPYALELGAEKRPVTASGGWVSGLSPRSHRPKDLLLRSLCAVRKNGRAALTSCSVPCCALPTAPVRSCLASLLTSCVQRPTRSAQLAAMGLCVLRTWGHHAWRLCD